MEDLRGVLKLRPTRDFVDDRIAGARNMRFHDFLKRVFAVVWIVASRYFSREFMAKRTGN